jgi:NAD-dependent deacetylase
MSDSLASLAKALEETRGLALFVTGAGVSLASGIPTFRGSDPGAVWKRDVTELGTLRYFLEDPAGSWQWYLARFDAATGAVPNPAHHALVALERWQLARGKFFLITQNIDVLHRRAGSQELIEVHGRADRVRCSRDGCALGSPAGSIARAELDFGPFRKEPVTENVPRCSACGAPVRPHVLWFDEYYQSHRDYQWARVLAAAEQAELVVFAGTSLSVGVTDLVLSAARERGAPVFSIDPAARPSAEVGAIAAPAEVALVELARKTSALPRT